MRALGLAIAIGLTIGSGAVSRVYLVEPEGGGEPVIAPFTRHFGELEEQFGPFATALELAQRVAAMPGLDGASAARVALVCGWVMKPSSSSAAMSLRTVAGETPSLWRSTSALEPTGSWVDT